jgi:hypothetical protein
MESSNWFLDIVYWFKRSAEGEDGEPSHRKIIAYMFFLMVPVMVFCTTYRNNPDLFSELIWISVIGGALGISYIRGMMMHKDEKHK